MPTLEQLEAAFRRYVATRRPEGPFAEFLPFASDQVADWEAAASSDSASADSAEVRFLSLSDARCGAHCTCSATAAQANELMVRSGTERQSD